MIATSLKRILGSSTMKMMSSTGGAAPPVLKLRYVLEYTYVRIVYYVYESLWIKLFF